MTNSFQIPIGKSLKQRQNW